MPGVGLLSRWRTRKREREAEEQALEDMRRAEGSGQPEPAEVKLSQMRD